MRLRGAEEARGPTGAEAKKIAEELRDWVAKEIGPIAKPKDIRFGDNLPKTRSGKIMRRLLRSIAKGEEIKQDVSTLENPAILEQLKQTDVSEEKQSASGWSRSACSAAAVQLSDPRAVQRARRRSSASRCSTPTSSSPGRLLIALMALVAER